MGYENLECNVRQSGFGRYLNDIIVQHHDMIVTSSDLGLALTCQYDLANMTVSNKEELDIDGDIETALNEEVVVESPTVIMKITSRDGSSMKESAEGRIYDLSCIYDNLNISMYEFCFRRTLFFYHSLPKSSSSPL